MTPLSDQRDVEPLQGHFKDSFCDSLVPFEDVIKDLENVPLVPVGSPNKEALEKMQRRKVMMKMSTSISLKTPLVNQCGMNLKICSNVMLTCKNVN